MLEANRKSAFIEDSGLIFEGFGLPRMAGRIMGYLMVTEEERVSFDEFVGVLQASKSSISINVKTLANMRLIKPVSISGSRKTWYTLSPDISLKEFLERDYQVLVSLNNLITKGVELRSNPHDNTSMQIKEIISFTKWFIKRFPEILSEWEDHKKSKGIE